MELSFWTWSWKPVLCLPSLNFDMLQANFPKTGLLYMSCNVSQLNQRKRKYVVNILWCFPGKYPRGSAALLISNSAWDSGPLGSWHLACFFTIPLVKKRALMCLQVLEYTNLKWFPKVALMLACFFGFHYQILAPLLPCYIGSFVKIAAVMTIIHNNDLVLGLKPSPPFSEFSHTFISSHSTWFLFPKLYLEYPSWYKSHYIFPFASPASCSL